MKTIKVNEIVITNGFADSIPDEQKVSRIRQYIEQNKCLDKPVILNGNVLVDGYIRYLIAIEMGMQEIPYVKALDYKKEHPNERVMIPFITGKFKQGRKEYTWKNDKGIPIEVGDRVLVNSKNKATGSNRGVVVVTKVFESDKSSMLRHKSVVKKIG